MRCRRFQPGATRADGDFQQPAMVARLCRPDLLTSIPVGCVPHRCEWGMLERAGHAGRSAEWDRQRGKKLQREKRKVAGGVRG